MQSTIKLLLLTTQKYITRDHVTPYSTCWSVDKQHNWIERDINSPYVDLLTMLLLYYLLLLKCCHFIYWFLDPRSRSSFKTCKTNKTFKTTRESLPEPFTEDYCMFSLLKTFYIIFCCSYIIPNYQSLFSVDVTLLLYIQYIFI